MDHCYLHYNRGTKSSLIRLFQLSRVSKLIEFRYRDQFMETKRQGRPNEKLELAQRLITNDPLQWFLQGHKRDLRPTYRTCET